jgi:cytochrome c553
LFRLHEISVRKILRASFVLSLGYATGASSQQPTGEKAAANPLVWAYPVTPPGTPEVTRSDKDVPVHLPGSDAAFSYKETQDPFNAPDWHPEAHPAMPEIVAHGRKPDVFACALCHLPNGQGHPESASLAGLPVKYILRQFADFRRGARNGADPTFAPGAIMYRFESKANDEEVAAAAKYFSSLKRKVWVRVVETETVPVTHPQGFMMVPVMPAETEAIGHRIIETPEHLEQTELRDDSVGTVAYVPVGSIARGGALAKTGGAGSTQRCAGCHGVGLKGAGNAPPIAGRSPSYTFRQLNDFQRGTRAGTMSKDMQKTVAKLTVDDMIDLSAYVASLRP